METLNNPIVNTTEVEAYRAERIDSTGRSEFDLGWFDTDPRLSSFKEYFKDMGFTLKSETSHGLNVLAVWVKDSITYGVSFA